MNLRLRVIVGFLTFLFTVLFFFSFIKYKSKEQDIFSILRLPITEDQILKNASRANSYGGKTIILLIDPDIKFENLPLYDITSYKRTSVYEDLETLINEYNMSVDEVEIRVYYVQQYIKESLLSTRSLSNPVYIISDNCSTNIIYSSIHKGAVVPIYYRKK